MARAYDISTLQAALADSSGAFTMVEIPDLQIPLFANRSYRMHYEFGFTAAATTTGIRIDINNASSSPSTAPTFLAGVLRIIDSSTEGTDSEEVAAINAFADVATIAVASAFTGGNRAVMDLLVVPAVNQVIIPRFATEIDTSAITLIAGVTHVEWREL